MKQRTSQIIYQYWNEVRGDRMAPRRFEIEPARIGQILPATFILERLDPTNYRFRLAGTRICEQFGLELRGSDFLDLWNSVDRSVVARHLAELSAQGGIGLLTLAAATGDRREAVFEAVILPLLHNEPTADRFLGAISAIDNPSWLGTDRLVSRRLIEHEVIWPDGKPHAVVKKLQQQTPFLAELAAARIVRANRRQFRVLDGGLTKRGGNDV
jgi:hypothetical protein